MPPIGLGQRHCSDEFAWREVGVAGAACPLAGGGSRQSGSSGSVPRHSPSRPSRQARAWRWPCRKDGSRCTCRSTRSPQAGGNSRRSLRIPSPACACCMACWCRRNRGSGCAGADCRRWSPCFGAGRWRPPAGPGSARHSPCAHACRRQGRVLETSAPIRRPPACVSSILSKPNPLTSMRCVGVSISSFMRSIRLVPPAMNLLPFTGQCLPDRIRSGGRALVREGPHAFTPATSAMASAMFE
jgi:hypothetical protein